MGLDPFQEDVGRIAPASVGAHGFALAGGNALLAHVLVQRPTMDVDLFTPEPAGPGAVAVAVCADLEQAGYDVEEIRGAEANRGEFVQLAVRRGERSTRLDLARDWRQFPPVILEVGPVLHLDDAVGSKVSAMVGRGLPRDFIDVAAAARPLQPRGPAAPGLPP